MQQQHGEVHDIPFANEFLKNTQALRVVGGLHMTGVKRGNCRDGVAEGSNIDIKAPLPKHQRSQKRKES